MQRLVSRYSQQVEEETAFYYEQLVLQKRQERDEFPVSPLFKLVMDVNNAYKCTQFAT